MKYENVVEDEGSTSYIAFEPTLIKSATDNVGTFDAANPDIRFSRPVEYVRHVRVADDAEGRGERSAGGVASSWELMRTAPTPLTTRGKRYVSLSLSGMVHLAKALGFGRHLGLESAVVLSVMVPRKSPIPNRLAQ